MKLPLPDYTGGNKLDVAPFEDTADAVPVNVCSKIMSG